MHSAQFSVMVMLGMVAGPAAVGRLMGTRIGAIKVDTESRYRHEDWGRDRDKSRDRNKDTHGAAGPMRESPRNGVIVTAAPTAADHISTIFKRFVATVIKNKRGPTVMIPVSLVLRQVLSTLLGIGSSGSGGNTIGAGADTVLGPGIEPYFPQNTGLY